ncbi:MAG: M12 family metallo-peptidase, partial [Bacteroidia bacterium]
MKKITLVFSAVLIACVSYSQNLKPVAQKIFERNAQRATFNHAQLFEITQSTIQRSAEMEAAVGKSTVFEFEQDRVNEILASKPENLNLTIPTNSGNNMELELYKATIFTPDFTVVTSGSNGEAVPYDRGAYYWGIIKGDNASLVSISIFNDEIMGIISSPSIGNMVLGKIEHDATNRHILYNERDLKAAPQTVCYTEDDGGSYTAKELQQNSSMRTAANCIRIYWEVNFDIYQNKGSVSAATNYVTGLFSQSAIIYTNDAIPVSLSQVLVWNTTSPYTSTSTSGLLSQFQSTRNSFNGELGNLLGYAGGGGVAAGFSGLCNGNLDNSQCYSGIQSSYNNVPTYSWSVMVVTHEQGHLMGSRHTHACVWNGNNTAIDNCGPTAGYGYEGSCSGAPTPTNGGTIMSYCHLNVGINFSNGFGTQPKNVILNNFNNATCLSSCSGGGCGTPGGLSASAITVSSATVTWSLVGGALTYNVQYKKSALTTWATVTGITGTSTSLTGLTDGTAYDYQVQAVCSSATGTYSTIGNFSTIAICNDTHEPNNTKPAASSLVINTNTAGLISPSGDADFFVFANTASQKNIMVTLTGLPADYDMKLIRKSATLGASQSGGTTSETIVYNASVVGNYVIKIYGSGGANNPTACYTLKAEISGTPFRAAASDNTTSKADADGTELSIYPNPANDLLVINYPSLSNRTCELQVFDVMGKEVFQA